MKALLVNIDLMVRVIVPNDADEKAIINAAVDKARLQSSDRGWLGEGITEWNDDEEMPFGTSPYDQAKLIGYQIESTDGKHNIPEGLFSFEIFYSKDDVKKWSDEHQLDGNWKVVPVYDGDIEGVTYVDEDIVE